MLRHRHACVCLLSFAVYRRLPVNNRGGCPGGSSCSGSDGTRRDYSRTSKVVFVLAMPSLLVPLVEIVSAVALVLVAVEVLILIRTRSNYVTGSGWRRYGRPI